MNRLRAVSRRLDRIQTRSLHTASIGNRSARPSASGRINPGRRARVERTRRFDQPSSSNLCNRCTACTASPEGQTCTAIRRGSAVNRESATRSAVAPERLLREHGRLDLADPEPGSRRLPRRPAGQRSEVDARRDPAEQEVPGRAPLCRAPRRRVADSFRAATSGRPI